MKTVIITGVSRGIGLATAKKFLNEGWKVIGTYHNNVIPIKHKNLTPLKYNQADSKSIQETAIKIKGITAGIDALINNAGILIDADEIVANPEKLRRTLEINVIGIVDLTEKLLPVLKKGSHIVNIDSAYGRISDPLLDDATAACYRISKAALNMYTRHLAFRLKQKGIIVSSLDPGWVKTDMGSMVATETEKPNRMPEQAASDIFNVVSRVKETGYFWKSGKKSKW